jgi:hypothetical protein
MLVCLLSGLSCGQSRSPAHSFYTGRCEQLRIGGQRGRQISVFLLILFPKGRKKSYRLEFITQTQLALFSGKFGNSGL